MKRNDQTDTEEAREAFLTTHWSLIGAIQAGEDRNKALIGLLLKWYWKPVYCYVRRKGYDNEQAKDLTQGFFHAVVLNRQLVSRADPSKGRFRSFLLHALNQYLINEKAKQTAGIRIPKDKLVPLDSLDPQALPAAPSGPDPQDEYNYAWVSALLDDVLATVRRECCADGLAKHWEAFDLRVVRPILEEGQPPSLEEVCARLDIADARKASNMIVTVKRRFQVVLRQRIRTTVLADGQVEEELDEIIGFLPAAAQDMR
jgi:hypothetical protein